jgi:hypothetical protein
VTPGPACAPHPAAGPQPPNDHGADPPARAGEASPPLRLARPPPSPPPVDLNEFALPPAVALPPSVPLASVPLRTTNLQAELFALVENATHLDLSLQVGGRPGVGHGEGGEGRRLWEGPVVAVLGRTLKPHPLPQVTVGDTAACRGAAATVSGSVPGSGGPRACATALAGLAVVVEAASFGDDISAATATVRSQRPRGEWLQGQEAHNSA